MRDKTLTADSASRIAHPASRIPYPASPIPQAGFTFLAMLFAVAVIGIGLAATSEVWSQSRQREQEQELLFIGNQFRRAIALYYLNTPGAVKRYPAKLEDLVQDNRYLNTQRYLRKMYPDPMTRKPEWGLVKAPDGGIMGVYSLSNASPIKRGGFRQRDRTFQGATTYHEWRFFHEPPAPLVSPKPPATSGIQTPVPPRATPLPKTPTGRPLQ